MFIQHLHRENFDRGMIATFGDTFRVEQGFTGVEANLHSALNRVAHAARDGSTRLYDSIEDMVNEFWRNGARNRPWLLTVVTDGNDNSSSRFRENPVAIGNFVRTHYNHEPSNFIFVIGVGDGNQINAKGLATMGDSGNFPAVTIGAFRYLERVFIEIAIDVSVAALGRSVDTAGLSWDEVARIYRVAQTPLDYAFLIDRSASMNEQG